MTDGQMIQHLQSKGFVVTKINYNPKSPDGKSVIFPGRNIGNIDCGPEFGNKGISMGPKYISLGVWITGEYQDSPTIDWNSLVEQMADHLINARYTQKKEIA